MQRRNPATPIQHPLLLLASNHIEELNQVWNNTLAKNPNSPSLANTKGLNLHPSRLAAHNPDLYSKLNRHQELSSDVLDELVSFICRICNGNCSHWLKVDCAFACVNFLLSLLDNIVPVVL